VPKKVINRIRELSADEEIRRLAFVRERALRDEVSLLNDAKREWSGRAPATGFIYQPLKPRGLPGLEPVRHGIALYR
tara:strand:- start:371 stop:601 length:231 start_codon:yes stop_codon:yes gene_type:complete